MAPDQLSIGSDESWFPPEVSTAGLRSNDLPTGDESLEFAGEILSPIWRFALTFDGPSFASQETTRFVADSVRADFVRHAEIPDLDLDYLRACLFHEHQYWRATGPGGPLPRGQTWEEAQPEHADFVRALVKAIYTRVYQEESWWWDPAARPELWERQSRALRRSGESRRLARLYELTAQHLAEVAGTYEGGLADEAILEALDPPIVHEPEPRAGTPAVELPDPYADARQRAVQRLALGLYSECSGAGFERVRAAESLAREAEGALRG